MNEAPAPPAPVPPPPRAPRKSRETWSVFEVSLAITGLAFAACSGARLAVLLLHGDDFTLLSGSEILHAFLRGLRFDAAAIFPVFGLPLFLLLLPVGGRWQTPWRQVWGWVCFGLLATFFFVLAADAVYFGSVHRHAGLEASEPGDAFKVLTTTAAVQYALPLVVFLAGMAGLFLAWRRLLRREVRPWPVRAAQIGAALAAAVLMYFGERGTLSGKRLRMVHAYQDTPVAAAQLSLNGPYCILHSLLHSRPVQATFYPWPEAVRTAQEAILVPGETVADPDYPLLRSRPPRKDERPNIVVILLESWDASATDAHRRELGLPPLGCTPNYDALAKEGLLCSRFYACGQRSMDGLGAMLCGVPSLPGTPYLGRGLEQSALTSLGTLARREGYDPWFIMSAERDSFRIDAIAGLTGFEHYLGAEDIPPSDPVVPRTGLRGACWDHEMFAEANRRLASVKRPFLAFLYTASTHHPFFWAGDRWGKRPATTIENRYLNSLEYGDWALGEFFRAARSAEWSANTVFFLTADHIGGPGYGVRRDDPSTLHHTPALLIAPRVTPGVNRRVASQLDVLPTLAELAGWGAPQAALGSSLFSDPPAGRGAICVQGNLLLRVEEGGFVLHSLADRVRGGGGPGADLDAIERRLLSITQAAYALLRTNRLARRE